MLLQSEGPKIVIIIPSQPILSIKYPKYTSTSYCSHVQCINCLLLERTYPALYYKTDDAVVVVGFLKNGAYI